MRTEMRDVQDNEIPVVEFVRPNGEQIERFIHCKDDQTCEKAQAIINEGFNFNLEYIGNAYSMCLSSKDHDILSEIVTSNGNQALFDMINKHSIEKLIEIRNQYEGME